CGGYEADGCDVIFFDASPICEIKCRQRKVVKSMEIENPSFHLKNDVINPISFEGIEYTADELWAHCTDSLLNDTIDLIEESNDCLYALFIGLDTSYSDSVRYDFQNRVRLMMKRNIEFDLTQYEDPSLADEALTADYIEIMNTMTDTMLTTATYKDQFYRELDKAQFFQSIGRCQAAIEVLDNMDNCLLDSVETAILSIWQARAAELSNYDYQIDSISAGNIQEPTLTDSAISQPSQNSSNYFFGCFISSHDDYSFVSCGENPEYRNITINSGNIFPNPADDQFFVETPNSNGRMLLHIYDMSGRKCLSITRSVNSNSITEINGVHHLPDGMYLVEFSTNEARYRQLLQIVH
ncbi:MAG: T9SS type A sorting domain-containing protein, partial [Flavobacteriales bacterium]